MASTRESENWDLTDKVYELEGQVRTLTNANEDGERQRGCLEKEVSPPLPFLGSFVCV